MKKIIYISVIFLLYTSIYSQTNLVPNPSFEQYTVCPDGPSELNYANNWIIPTTGTPDYFNACWDSTISWISIMDVPQNFIGYQTAHHGSAYSGIYLYTDPSQIYREYIQIQLSLPLISGVKYYLHFVTSLADSCRFATDDIGAYFSIGQITRNDFDAFNYVPQIKNNEGVVLSNKALWYDIYGVYTAVGNENYITIGNFLNNINTDTIRVLPNHPNLSEYNTAYYYIDNLCLSTDSNLCYSSISLKSNELTFSNIYSNSDKIYFRNIEPNSEITVYNIQGERILQETVSGSITLNPNLNTGIYFIKFQNKNSQYFKKIYINKNQQL